jgi:hypothetical protein
MGAPFPNGPAQIKRTAPRRGELLDDFVFDSPTMGRLVVEKGFDTDYASVPRIFWAIYPPDGAYTDAAVVHDWAYWYQTMTREEADNVFLEAMAALGIPWLRRHILHKAVRAGGWLAWKTNARKIAEHSAA